VVLDNHVLRRREEVRIKVSPGKRNLIIKRIWKAP
jgi:hypothetical protein